MSETNHNDDTTSEAATPQLSIKSIYLRNLSLETASSPILLCPGIQPEMKLEVRVNINPLENQDEVVLDLTIMAGDNNNLLYLIKIQQAGCFVLNGLTAEQKAFYLNITCPHLLYPYASHMANTLSVQGGFPPVNLMPIDFVHFYAQHQAQPVQKPQNEAVIQSEIETAAPKNKWAELAVSAD